MEAKKADISTSFLFLKHDEKWKDEKPYSIMYQPPEGIQKNNFSLEKHNDIHVHDIRELEPQPSVEQHGFALIGIERGSLACEEFDDKAKVASQFLPTAAKAVKSALGAGRVQFFDVTVCHSLASPSHIIIKTDGTPGKKAPSRISTTRWDQLCASSANIDRPHR
jgi:hypothetical protein